MKSNFIKISLCFLCLLFLNACNNKQTVTSSYYTYKTECLGVELDGSQTLRAWGTGKNKKDAIEQAKKNAIHDILFQGIHDGQSKCSVKPLLTEVNAADKYEDYFNAFFLDKGSYQTFVSGEENGRTTRIQEAIKNQLKYGIVVRVFRSELKRRLQADGILK